MIHIAIDGPSGAGKSTVAKALAKELHFVYVDTGAMYRAVGLYTRRHGASPTDPEAVAALLPDVSVTLEYAEDGSQRVLLNGEDVSLAIRENEISQYASAVSKIPAVRAHLLTLQRDMARTHDLIMDGRDIGTVVLPDAALKIFMVARPEARARRRTLELLAKGQDVEYETILAEINARDEQDRTRAVSPAIPAEDAVMMDNSDMTVEENVEAIRVLMRERGLLGAS
ncbi:MAG: (d)CMP kinase [Clostridia bacterium]|nr:(d)CMP kinase [Clostridia bacterium]